ncbi:MAG: hypothetical protein N3A57_05845, partial [Negativicutes bacterium]|nr:hypothetical protein [Negativicutes bacterium]
MRTKISCLALLVLVAAVVTAGIADASPGPNANTIQLQTYGELPVVMINLTPYPATVTLCQQNWQMYQNSPVAIGATGLYYQTSAAPVPINGLGGPGTPALAPAVNPITDQTTSTDSWISNSPFINHFLWFPTWTNYNQIGYTQLVQISSLSNTDSGL